MKLLTPVYNATSCGHIQAELTDLNMDGTAIRVGLEVSVHCQNPNPYAVEILSSRPGRVLVGAAPEEPSQARTAIGNLEVVPGSMLPSAGEGIVRVKMNAKLTGESSGMLIPEFLGDSSIPILLELRFNVGIKVYFVPFLPPWSPPQAPAFKKACGLNMIGVLVNQFVSKDATSKESRLGPLVCRESFHGMVIPPVGESPPDGMMDFTAAQVAPTEVAAGEIAKDASLLLVIFICFFVAFISWHVWMYGRTPPTLTTLRNGCSGCYESIVATMPTLPTLTWNTTVPLESSPPYDPKSTEEKLLLDISKGSDMSTPALGQSFKRPRNQTDLSSTDSQAMLISGGMRDSRDMATDAMEESPERRPVTLLQPDRQLSQVSSKNQSRSPSRPSRITSTGRLRSGTDTGTDRLREGRKSDMGTKADTRTSRSASPSLRNDGSASEAPEKRRSSPGYISDEPPGPPSEDETRKETM